MTVEEVITKYVLDARLYESGAKAVVGASKLASNAATAVGNGFSKATGVLKNVALGVGVLAYPMVSMANNAIEAGMAWDTLSRSLTGLVGSGQRAGEILAFVDKLAIPSIFTSMDLGEAAKTLEAFGLTTERFLPLAEKLGTVFGGTKEKLDSFVTSLGYLQSERFGEAFESLARGGISRTALTAEGLKFDKGGQYLGSVSEALTAVEKLVNQRFGRISKEMAGGPAALFASFGDAVNRVMRTLGLAILKNIIPVVVQLGDAFSNLAKSGILESVTSSIAGMFNTRTIGDMLIKTIAGILAGLEQMPKLVADIEKLFMTAFSNIRIAVVGVGAVLAGIFLTPSISKGILAMVTAFKALRASIISVGIVATITKALVTGGVSALNDLKAAIPAILVGVAAAYGLNTAFNNIEGGIQDLGKMPSVRDFTKRQKEIEASMKGGGSGNLGFGSQNEASGKALIENLGTETAGKLAEMGTGGGLPQDQQAAGISEQLKSIAKSSKDTAENTQKLNDINDRVLGGGSLAQRGLSRQELTDISTGQRSGSREIKGLLVELGVAFEREISRKTSRAIGNNVTRREV
jgi:hypothetical protein